MDSDGFSDPYVVCILGAKKKKTKIAKHTLVSFPKLCACSNSPLGSQMGRRKI